MSHPESEQSIERLIKLAGERDMPSPEGMERARRAAHESWSRMVAHPHIVRRSRARAMLGFAVAAGLAVAALVIFTDRADPAPAVLVAHIATIDGNATLHESKSETQARVGLSINSGSLLATGEGRVALTFGDSLSLRLDRHTRLHFDGREQITLLAGALYVDSGGINAVPALRIGTPAGEVRHVGTQFQVQVAGNTTRVLVREGRVVLTRVSGAPTDITAGDELRVTGADLQWRHGLPSFGADWQWSAGIAPVLEIENRPLAEFLAWMVREQGWQLRYGDESLQQRTHEIRLHGSLADLDAAAMLERVSLVTGVHLSERDGVLWIGGERR